MTDDQRRAFRFEVAVAAEVFTGQDVVPAGTRNLSETGVCLDIDRELPEDISVGVSMFLITDGIEDPDQDPVNIKAKVIWCSQRDDVGFSAGMRFDELASPQSEAIESFLKKQT